MAIYDDNFSVVFTGLLTRFSVTCYEIGEYTGLDQAYLSRLQSGERTNPSSETIMKIGLALAHFSEKITLHDLESLFRSVGHSLFRDRQV